MTTFYEIIYIVVKKSGNSRNCNGNLTKSLSGNDKDQGWLILIRGIGGLGVKAGKDEVDRGLEN